MCGDRACISASVQVGPDMLGEMFNNLKMSILSLKREVVSFFYYFVFMSLVFFYRGYKGLRSKKIYEAFHLQPQRNTIYVYYAGKPSIL